MGAKPTSARTYLGQVRTVPGSRMLGDLDACKAHAW